MLSCGVGVAMVLVFVLVVGCCYQGGCGVAVAVLWSDGMVVWWCGGGSCLWIVWKWGGNVVV